MSSQEYDGGEIMRRIIGGACSATPCRWCLQSDRASADVRRHGDGEGRPEQISVVAGLSTSNGISFMTTIFRVAVLGILLGATGRFFVDGTQVSAQSSQDPIRRPRLALRVPKPPTVAPTANGAVLVYELHVMNVSPQPWTILKIDVLSAASGTPPVLALAPDAIEASIARPGTSLTGADRRILGGSGWAVIYMWVPVDAAAPPASVFHRLTLEASSAAGPQIRELDGPAIPVLRDLATIGPPLRGGPWRASNGPSNESGHRRVLTTLDAAERFAIDYVKLGDDNLAFSGDRQVLENHHAYGAEVLAVAEGVIVSLQDGIPDRVGPPQPSYPFDLTGNRIILDVGGTRYATYSHLKPGSIRVKVGQRVRRGDVIALLGNSGNAPVPHLHFQVQDAPGLATEGVPYRHESFEVIGQCQGPPVAGQCTRTPAMTRRNEIPLNSMIVQFPR
jgi:murein DD-endopeptidase